MAKGTVVVPAAKPVVQTGLVKDVAAFERADHGRRRERVKTYNAARCQSTAELVMLE